jgi:hypothetical protein
LRATASDRRKTNETQKQNVKLHFSTAVGCGYSRRPSVRHAIANTFPRHLDIVARYLGVILAISPRRAYQLVGKKCRPALNFCKKQGPWQNHGKWNSGK